MSIRQSWTLRQDPYFYLERVETESAERFLVRWTNPACGEESEALLEREFSLFQRLEGALRPRHQARIGQRRAFFYDDFSGQPLSSHEWPSHDWARGAELPELRALVRQLCALLSAAHAQGVILTGLTPESFLWEPQSQRASLADAAFACVRNENEPQLLEPHWFRRPFLDYTAPEALGRTARQIDPRADLYSLGAILYRLLAGEAPFAGADESELIQCHLARTPRRLPARAASSLEHVAALVMQLLAKAPEERPDSAESVALELEAALDAAAPSSYPRAGPRCQPALRFQAPRALHGREGELALLRGQFRQRRQRPAIFLVEGDAGIGKTALVQHAERLDASEHRHARHFCSGRFEQGPHAPALSGWVTALRGLAHFVLVSDPAELHSWRAKLLSGLGDGAPWIAALAPEWASILRCAPATPSTNLETALERLAMSLHRLLTCFTDDERSVIVFLDDLQWADASSLRILSLLLTAQQSGDILFVAALRTEVGGREPAPVQALLEALARASVEVNLMSLDPLGAAELRGLFEDSSDGQLEGVAHLAQIAATRFGGIPLLAIELLAALSRHGLLSFEPTRNAWRYDAASLDRLPLGEDAVGLLSSKLEALPPALERALTVAAHLGRQFSLAELSRILENEPSVSAAELEAAVALGLLRFLPPVSASAPGANEQPPGPAAEASFEFAHDRIHEVCHSRASGQQAARLSLKIARALLSMYGQDPPPEVLLRVASHLNAGRSLIESWTARIECAELNLKAGRIARRRGGFSRALEHFVCGLELVGAPAQGSPEDDLERAWSRDGALTLALHQEAAEAALLNGQHDLMHRLCDAALSRLHEAVDKVPLYDVRISGFKAEKRFDAAVGAALEILAELEVRFPGHPHPLHVLRAYFRTRRRLFSEPLERLSRLPPMRDATALAAMRIVQCVYPAAYLGRPALFPLLVCHHVDTSLEYGNEPYSAVTYSGFAAVLCAMGDVGRAVELGRIAIGLLDTLNASSLLSRAYTVYYFLIFPWSNPLSSSVPPLAEASASGLAHGDFEFAGYAMTMHSLARLHAGAPLALLETEFQDHRERLVTLGREHSALTQSIQCQIVHDLRHAGKQVLRGPSYDIEQMLPKCLEPFDVNLVFHNYLAELMLAVLLDERALALEAAERGRPHLARGAFGVYLAPVFIFYESLALAAAPRALRRRVRLAQNRRKLRRWARRAPMNFLHKYHLVAAECLRLGGRREKAARHYERAMALAIEHGFTHETALAQERAALHYLQADMPLLGASLLCECRQSYQRWGAVAKVERLQRKYAHLFAVSLSRDGRAAPGAGASFADTFDYRRVIKASQAISSEVVLPRLLETLMRTIIEHAAAQRGLLLLESDGELYIEAEADVDAVAKVTLDHEPLSGSQRLAASVAHYAARTERPVVLADAASDALFADDPYIKARAPRSLSCTPFAYRGRLIGLVYLENNRLSHVFTEGRLEIIRLLASQAAISIANARFHSLQLEAERAKINPHFLFNALSSIAEVCASEGPAAEHAVLKLAKLYRFILENSSEQLVPLELELRVLRDYLELEKLRFGRKLEFAVEVQGDVERVMLPGLLLQPLVENSVRHGVARKLGAGRVSVRAMVGATTCIITVHDDGDGGSAAQTAPSGTGFGLRSVQQRLALVYGADYSYRVSGASGHTVEIEIPVAPSQHELEAPLP